MGHAFATKLELVKATAKHLRSVQWQPGRIEGTLNMCRFHTRLVNYE